MSAQPKRHLQIVEIDDETGEFKHVDSRELAQLQQDLAKAKADLKNAERDLRGKRATIARMEADKVRARLEHPQRELIVRICRYWWRKIHNENPRRNPLTPDRFDAVAALVELEELVKEDVPGSKRGRKRRQWLYQMEHFKAAIDGAAHEPYTNTLRNGKVERYDDLTTIFKTSDSLLRHIGRCPYELVPILPARPAPGVDTARDGSTLHVEGSKPPSSLDGTHMEVNHGGQQSRVGCPVRIGHDVRGGRRVGRGERETSSQPA